MINKILGGAIILAALIITIFLIRFLPYYWGSGELERFFGECIGNLKQYTEEGCRAQMAPIIKRRNLNIDPDQVIMDVELYKKSHISADWIQTIDFWGIYKYEHPFHIEHTGVPPDRD